MLLSLSARRVVAVAPRLRKRDASSIALKYSQAVYNAALGKSPATLTKVHVELVRVSSAIKTDTRVKEFLFNPTLSARERATGLSTLYTQLGKQEPLSDTTKNLLSVLSENGRLAETPGVIEGFDELVAKYKGELTVVVTSAAPLPRDVQSRLEATLKQSQAAQQAKVVKIVNKASRNYIPIDRSRTCNFALQINPSVLGGIVVDFGDKTIDLSVQSRVNKLNSIL
ncbi:OSCP, subunit 5 of the stator stalk of mitochondrial F1F0 ATP synthase, partial [Fistulina hepatica ATCC 64428]